MYLTESMGLRQPSRMRRQVWDMRFGRRGKLEEALQHYLIVKREKAPLAPSHVEAQFAAGSF